VEHVSIFRGINPARNPHEAGSVESFKLVYFFEYFSTLKTE
jgi:hypothetical protein